jgi:hypothetical protein
MKPEPRPNILAGFDFKLLDDQEFLEDSVREEIIAPILRGLGYTSSKPHRVIRSRKLLHPFVSIGSVSKKIYIVPDYVLEVDDRLAWVLEAKAPSEDVANTKHVEQAYSYAIHSEIRVPYFALCNGRDFVLYHISKPQPVLQFPTIALPMYWDNLSALLSPQKVLDVDLRLAKDFGLHLKRLGFHEFRSLVFPNVPITFIGKIGNDHYTIGSGIKPEGGDSYVATFDFDHRTMQQLEGKIPDKAYRLTLKPITNSSTQVQFADTVYLVTVDCRVGDTLAENEDEIFLPLWVNKFL